MGVFSQNTALTLPPQLTRQQDKNKMSFILGTFHRIFGIFTQIFTICSKFGFPKSNENRIVEFPPSPAFAGDMAAMMIQYATPFWKHKQESGLDVGRMDMDE